MPLHHLRTPGRISATLCTLLLATAAALRRTNGTLVATTFTREDGTFEFAAPAAGRYVVAFSTLGMVEAVAPLDSLHPASDVDRTFEHRRWLTPARQGSLLVPTSVVLGSPGACR